MPQFKAERTTESGALLLDMHFEGRCPGEEILRLRTRVAELKIELKTLGNRLGSCQDELRGERIALEGTRKTRNEYAQENADLQVQLERANGKTEELDRELNRLVDEPGMLGADFRDLCLAVKEGNLREIERIVAEKWDGEQLDWAAKPRASRETRQFDEDMEIIDNAVSCRSPNYLRAKKRVEEYVLDLEYMVKFQSGINSELKKVTKPRPMSEAPRDGSTIYKLVPIRYVDRGAEYVGWQDSYDVPSPGWLPLPEKDVE